MSKTTRPLNEDEQKELKKWMGDKRIDEKKLHMKFSDAVAVAQLLKKIHPKLVETHNYQPRSSIKLKLNNWETLNHKVLAKLGLQRKVSTLEKLAKGIPGSLESLLYDVMMQDQAKLLQKEDRIWSDDNQVLTITAYKKECDEITSVQKKLILYSVYDQKKKEVVSTDLALEKLNNHIHYLENMLQAREEHIKQQTEKLAKRTINGLLNIHY